MFKPGEIIDVILPGGPSLWTAKVTRANTRMVYYEVLHTYPAGSPWSFVRPGFCGHDPPNVCHLSLSNAFEEEDDAATGDR